MKYAWLTLLLLAILPCGACGGGNPGIWEVPVLLPIIREVSVPAGPITAGSSAQFMVRWDYGRKPCEVKWTFPEKPDKLEVLQSTSEQSLTVDVVLESLGQAGGSVVVTDLGGNSVVETFTYEVIAAP